jgi:Tfp pilus assembly protein PilF
VTERNHNSLQTKQITAESVEVGLILALKLAGAPILLVALLHPALAAAQEETPGLGATVGMRVTSREDEHPLERVRVDLLRFPDEYIQEGFTDAVGRLELQGLGVPGAYIVRSEKDGYRTTEVRFDLRRGESGREVSVQMPRLKDESTARRGGVSSARALSIPPPASKEFQKGTESLNKKKSPRASIEHFQNAVAIYPGYFEAYFLLGMAYLQLNSPSEAQDALRHAINLNPKFLEAYYPLAALLIGKQECGEGQRLLRRAQELDPNDWRWPFELARSEAYQKQWDQALAYGQSALKMLNAPPKVHLLMADLYSNTGKPDKAIEELEEFEKLDPSSPYIPRVHRVIAELRKRQPSQ